MPDFDFLKASWGIELKAEAQTYIKDRAESTNRRDVENYLKATDIRKFGIISGLPKDIARIDAIPAGQYLVQLMKIYDVTQPAKFQEEFEGGKWRLLALELSDGEQKMKAVEYHSVKSLGVHLPPGTKLLLWSTPQCPLRVQNGHLLLTPDTVEVLGGEVEKLLESWQASKEVEANRMLWRTEGIKKNDKLDPAPPWVDFNPAKARGGHNKAAIDAEQASWRQPVNFTGTTGGSKGGSTRDEDGQARFHKADFTQSESGPLGQVSSSAFAQAQGSGKGKGKGDKGKGESRKGDGGGGAGGKRGRRGGWEDEGGEEKRAPVAASTLAAFIKPGKKGELPDESISLLAEPAPAEASEPQWGSSQEWAGGWDAGWKTGGGWSSGRGGGGGGNRSGGKGRSKGNKGNRQGGSHGGHGGGWQGGW